MDENKELQETTQETVKEENPILEYGSSIIQTSKGTVHVLTIVGQVEGHQVLPPSSKSTKYEHVMPLLAMVEESEAIDGLLVLLNTVCPSPRSPWCWEAGIPSECLWRYRPSGLLLPPRRL